MERRCRAPVRLHCQGRRWSTNPNNHPAGEAKRGACDPGTVRRGERIEHFETIRVAKDGRRVDISLTVSPLRDAEGCVIGASKVARDITERKRAEASLREAEHRKDEFLALLAHELEPVGAAA